MQIDRNYLRDKHGLSLPADHLLDDKKRWELYQIYPRAFSEPPPKPASRLPAYEPRRQEPARSERTAALTPEQIEKIVNKRVVDKMLKEHGNNPGTHRGLEAAGLEVAPPVDAQTREAIAIEEAAHAIEADTQGLKAHDLYVNRVGTGQYNYHGGDFEKLLVPNDTNASVKRIVSLFAAGYIAQRIKYGKVLCLSGTDVEVIRKYLLLAKSPDDVRAEAEAETEATLRERWAEVERVAVQLQLYGQLDAKRFYELIESRVGQPTTQVRKATMPMMVRSATMSAANNSEVELIWTTGASVRRSSYVDGPYDEVLETGESNVRLGRLNAGAPLLNSHDFSDLSRVLGSVVPGSAKMVNGQGIARIKLSARAEVAGLVQDIVAGVIRGVSVGYRCHRVEVDKRGDVPVWRVTDWEPMEISAVAIGSDAGSQFRGDEKYECEVRG